MNFEIPLSWREHLQAVRQAPYFDSLLDFVREEYAHHTCFPPERELFAAFEHCSWDDTRVILLGQDPYHGAGQANGLCFSVHEGVPHPPSLINIFKEMGNDLGLPYPNSGNLQSWADQGVLLLNATLSVRAGAAGSHQRRGWETFTDQVIQKLSQEKEGLVFLLWGGFAQKKASLIDPEKHHILTSGHPSPLSANRGYWFGNKHFSKTNALLLAQGLFPIDWEIKG